MRIPPDPEKASENTLRKRVVKVCEAFELEKGELDWDYQEDPLAALVETLLSHNTNDRNRDMAFKALMEKYDSWQAVHLAPREELETVIRPAGLNRQKAARIQELLEYILQTRGQYEADFLRSMTFDEAVEELGHLKGVGFKTLAVVLCFTLGVDIFPVDTHVHRICKRLGFVPEKFDAVKTFKAMRYRIPAGKSYQFHLHLITYGRETCKARNPDCKNCFIRNECRFLALEL